MSEYEFGEAPPAKQMATDTWCNHNSQLIKAYVELRIRGWSGIKSMRRIFGEEYYDSNISARVNSLEGSEFYRSEFNDQLASTPISTLWDEKLSINKLLGIVNDDLEKGSTRLNAIRELNVLVGITIIDENGKTRKGNKVGDFYKDIGTEPQRGASGQIGDMNYGPSPEEIKEMRQAYGVRNGPEGTEATDAPTNTVEASTTPYAGQAPYEGA